MGSGSEGTTTNSDKIRLDIVDKGALDAIIMAMCYIEMRSGFKKQEHAACFLVWLSKKITRQSLLPSAFSFPRMLPTTFRVDAVIVRIDLSIC